jgi:hypothetical protein
MSTCGDLIDSADIKGMFLNRIVTEDETWSFQYEPQWTACKQPSSPRKKKQRQDRSRGKAMLPLFVDSSGTVHMEFIPEGATVNKHCYKQILHCLCNSIHRKRPEFWGRKNCLYLQNTSLRTCPRGTARTTGDRFATLSSPTWSHTMRQFPFLSLLEIKPSGSRFRQAEEIVTATREAVGDLPASIFRLCFQHLYQLWESCISDKRYYFEGGCVSVCILQIGTTKPQSTKLFIVVLCMTVSVVQWSEFLAKDPEVRVRFPALKSLEYGLRDPSRWSRGTLYQQKLAPTSPILHSRIQATEFNLDFW